MLRRADPVIVEQAQPALGALLAPGYRPPAYSTRRFHQPRRGGSGGADGSAGDSGSTGAGDGSTVAAPLTSRCSTDEAAGAGAGTSSGWRLVPGAGGGDGSAAGSGGSWSMSGGGPTS